jgi:hypothetical protein
MKDGPPITLDVPYFQPALGRREPVPLILY